MNIMKFGGSCLKDKEGFLHIMDILKKEKEAPVLVLSAIYGITDMIIEGIHSAIISEESIPDTIRALESKHYNIINSIVKDMDIKEKTKTKISDILKKLEKLFYGIAYTNEISLSIKANILSFGERMAILVMEGFLKSYQIKAIAKDAGDIGLITDCSYENAIVSIEKARRNLIRNLMPLHRKNYIIIISGYFGCSEEGRITLFGRNGTDYSAGVIACILKADNLIIWKDVDGFMSADPKLVPLSRKIDHLSFYEAAELSYFGAQILHPRTLESLINKKINIYLRNIYNKDKPGTIISSQNFEKENIIKSVTYNKNISMLKILGPGVGYKPGIIGIIGNKLASIGINIVSVITSQTCINILLNKGDIKKSYDSLKGLINGIIRGIVIKDDIALIAVVGEGLLRTKGLAARVFRAIADQDINIEMTSAGASEFAYYFIVKEKELKTAVNAVHKDFFGDM